MTTTATRIDYLEEQLEKTTQLAERLLVHLFPPSGYSAGDISDNVAELERWPDWDRGEG